MIAANHQPGSRFEKRRSWGKEVGVPTRPVVAIGRTSATRISGRAWRLAIEIVAKVYHEVRFQVRGRLCQPGERPRCRIVACLKSSAFDSAARISEHKNALRVGGWRR